MQETLMTRGLPMEDENGSLIGAIFMPRWTEAFKIILCINNIFYLLNIMHEVGNKKFQGSYHNRIQRLPIK